MARVDHRQHDPSLETSLLSAVRSGLNRAVRARGAAVLTCSTRLRTGPPAHSLDAWSWLDACRRVRNQPVVAWSSPDGRASLVALGAARQASLPEVGRFEAARAFCSTLNEHTVKLGRPAPDDLPRVLAGFAFDGRSVDGPWRGWGAGWLVLPELMIVSNGSETWMSVNLDVPAGAASGDVLARAEALAGWIVGRGPAADRRLAARDEAAPRVADEEADSWRARVRSALAAIEAGHLRKVVLARSVHLPTPSGSDIDVEATAQALHRDQPDASVFLFRRPSLGAFVGATPEPLVSVRDGWVETVALAGTRGRSTDRERDLALERALLDDPKERREHRLVVAAIEEALKPFCSSLARPDEPRVARLPHMRHLATCVRGRLVPNADILHLVEALHPTPAVGGWPRERATHWLAHSEALQRGWYAGPVGWLDGRGNGTLAVAIRSALTRERGTYVYAGAGIVSGSDPDAEWAETELKTSTMRHALALRSADPPPDR